MLSFHRSLAFSMLALQLTMATGCVTDIINKYRTPTAPAVAASKGEAGKNSPRKAAAPRQGVYAVDQGTYRLLVTYDRAWEALLDVLLRNYNLAIADRANGLVTTEWDSYYLDGKVHRNKVSLRLKRLGGQGTELLVYNNVEVLSKMPDGGITEIWLPTDKNRQEVTRIVQNMAMALNLAKPDLPDESVALPTPAGRAAEPAAAPM